MTGATHRGLIDRIGLSWARAAETGGSHFAGLDAVRFAAALMVVFTHWGPSRGAPSLVPFGPWGGNGVALFFVLSGYLLWRPFVQGKPSTYRYALTRAARILPAWWLAVLVLVPLKGGDVSHYLAMVDDGPALGVAWTLQAEVMFYLAVPLLALFGRPLLVPVVLGLASLGLDVAASSTQLHGTLAESMLPLRFWAFVPGMILASTGWRGNRFALAGGLALLCIGAATNDWWGGQWTNLATVGGAGLVVSAALGMRAPAARLWAAGAAISYGLYLWHVDLIDLTGPWIGLPLAFIVASASYLLLERPVMRWAHSRRRVPAVAEELPRVATVPR